MKREKSRVTKKYVVNAFKRELPDSIPFTFSLELLIEDIFICAQICSVDTRHISGVSFYCNEMIWLLAELKCSHGYLIALVKPCWGLDIKVSRMFCPISFHGMSLLSPKTGNCTEIFFSFSIQNYWSQSALRLGNSSKTYYRLSSKATKTGMQTGTTITPVYNLCTTRIYCIG